MRAVALGPGGLGTEQRYASNRARYAETATPWARLWADWARLQPDADSPPDLGALDADIAAAKADGLRVMLTAWRFPRWANGTDSVDDATYRLEERIPAGGDPARRKDLTFKVPGDLSPDSAWGRWIDRLIGRYAGRLDALEIVNEPNLQLWPQPGIAESAAAMIETAVALAARHSDAPRIVGPATADVGGEAPLRTGYEEFTRAVLDRLGDPGPGFSWSHHNYTDVEEDRAGPDSGVARVGALLGGRRPLLVTESGARLNRVAQRFGLTDADAARLKQGELIERGLRRLQLGPEGDGVELVCQYLFVTDMNYDSGLCDLDGTPRPAYYAWAELPTLR